MLMTKFEKKLITKVIIMRKNNNAVLGDQITQVLFVWSPKTNLEVKVVTESSSWKVGPGQTSRCGEARRWGVGDSQLCCESLTL